MADDVDIPVVSTATVATDEVAGRHFQMVKLVDSTADSADPTGVAANPLVTEARLTFVDYDDSIVPVTDNDANHALPVAVRSMPAVSISGAVGIYGTSGSFTLTGPSDGVWRTNISGNSSSPLAMLYVNSTGGTPTVAAFGASSFGGTYDQQLPLLVPVDGELVAATTFTPGTGARFCYIAIAPPFLEIRAVSGGTSDPVDAYLEGATFVPPVTLTAVSGTVTVVDGGSTVSIDDGAGSITVDGTVAVSGTTAISASALPLPSGAATAAKQPALGTAGTASADVLSVQGIASGTALKVDGSAATQPVSDGGGSLTVDGTVAVSGTTAVSAASLPLPSGAATSAKQPALGTAGTASTDVITVQGIASGTAQPVSDGGGSLTVDNGGTFAVQAAQSGTWNVATVTNVVHVDDNAGSLTVDGTVAISGTTAVSAAALPLPSGAATAAKQPALGTAGTAATDVITVQGIASGTAQPVSDGGGSLTVDGIIVAAGFLSEDAAHSSGDGGFFGLTVRQSEANSLSSTAGTDGDYAAFTTDARGLLQVSARPYVSRIRVASSGLTTVTTAYTIGDTAGAIMTFAGAARVSGGTGTILSAVLLDKGDVGVDYRLHIYRASVTLSSDNAAWAVSDTDQESLIGIVSMPTLIDVGANRVATIGNLGLPYDCAATSLFVGIETRTANAVYAAATDLHLILTLALD
jgi:hypothetical protein